MHLQSTCLFGKRVKLRWLDFRRLLLSGLGKGFPRCGGMSAKLGTWLNVWLNQTSLEWGSGRCVGESVCGWVFKQGTGVMV